MKIKKIISSAVLAVMVFTMVIAAFPMTLSAAYTDVDVSTGTTATANLTQAELDKYLESYLKYNYSTAEEMLKDELAAGYLYTVNSANNLYSLYVNKYTGFVFYKNNVTGQILTSNPVDPNNTGDVEALMSQVEINFFKTADPSDSSNKGPYFSYRMAAMLSQLSVSPISGGLRVSYILGDTTPRYLLPGAIRADRFEEYILIPMIKAYVERLVELCQEADPEAQLDFFNSEDYIAFDDFGYVNKGGRITKGLQYYIENMNSLCKDIYGRGTAEYISLFNIGTSINNIIMNYTLYNPQDSDTKIDDKTLQQYPLLKEGTALYLYATDKLSADKKKDSTSIKTYCPDYTFSMMYADEKECDFVNVVEQKPAFRCSIEYSFNDDGSLSVSMPASSVTFDSTVYTLDYVKILQYFGTADAYRDGYIFFPDGSGTVIDFGDFYNEETGSKTKISINAAPYGKDYCYSKITGAHRQQITMPVYGLVTEVNANAATTALYGKNTVVNGFFAVVEEGSALSSLQVSSGGSTNKYITVSGSFDPRPKDEFDLSGNATAEGAQSSYTKVSEAKYSGSFTTRYVMLTDEEIGEVAYGNGAFYASDYVGMAAYYKNLLRDNGTLSTLQAVSTDLPLYIEVLGAMDIMAKFLSFPITKTIALTSFDDVLTMYKELSECKRVASERALEYEKLAEETDDEILKTEYTNTAAEYRELEATVENIKNINFRLTGFANGGMNYTYPAKLRWERACGGQGGFETLVQEAEKLSVDNVNFGVYADFDFMYINNTASFDGIGNRGNVSKRVDNRYASKQLYDNVLQVYDSFFDLVISSDAIDKFYTKIADRFSDMGSNKISVSTLGSDLNSNFDEDNPINREDAMQDLAALFDKMKNKDGYEIMTDVGNVYTVEYATHILNATIDSSHFRYASYAVPFFGLVLHSYVNYTGTPLNYSGNVEYEILKSIENGAAPYYILCYQNSAYLKEDEELNKYYGVSYENWYTDIVETYTIMNNAIGDLQDYEIVDHTKVICERVIEEAEMQANYKVLQAEILELLDVQLSAIVDKSFDELKAGGADNYDKRLKLSANREALAAQFKDILNVSEIDEAFMASVDALIKKYTDEYPGAENAANNYEVVFEALEYNSKYSFITDSAAFDKEYVKTDYTIDNGNVTMVTYMKGDHAVSFFLNYNNYSVNIRLDANTVIELPKFSYERIG